MNIINETSAGGNIGSALGQGLNQGISAGLNQLLNQKVQEMQYKKQLERVQPALKYLGLSNEQAPLLIADPKLAGTLINAKREEEYRNRAANALENAYNGTNSLPGMLNQNVNNIAPQSNFLGQNPGSQVNAQGLAENAVIPNQNPVNINQIPNQVQNKSKLVIPPGLRPEDQDKFVKRFEKQRDQEFKERKHQEELEFKIGKEKRAEEHNQRKAFQELDKQYSAKAERAEKDKNIASTLVKLAQSGELNTPGAIKFLDAFKLGNWKTNATFIADKLSNQLYQGASQAFGVGGNLNVSELEAYQRALGSIYIPDLAKEVVFNTKILESDAEILNNEAKKQILKENNGIPTHNMQDQINERTAEARKHLFAKAQDIVNQALEIQKRHNSKDIYTRNFTQPSEHISIDFNPPSNPQEKLTIGSKFNLDEGTLPDGTVVILDNGEDRVIYKGKELTEQQYSKLKNRK